MISNLSVKLEEFHSDLEGVGTYYRATVVHDLDGGPVRASEVGEGVADGRGPGEAFEKALGLLVGIGEPEVPKKGRARESNLDRTHRRAKAKRRSPSARGAAREAVLEAVRAQPGVTTRQIAESTGFPVESLYRAVKQLENDDLVVKDGRALHAVVAQADDAEAA